MFHVLITDLGLIDMFSANQSAEVVAYMQKETEFSDQAIVEVSVTDQRMHEFLTGREGRNGGE